MGEEGLYAQWSDFFCLGFKMGMKVEAGAEIRGSEVLKNRGIIQKRKDLETFMSFAKH